MALRTRLWDAVYAIAEPFVKMHRSEKEMVVFLLVVMSCAWVAGLLRIDQRIIVCTAIASMLVYAIVVLLGDRI
jgi:uncharacterized membrane protein YjjP (DUF1212 family)